MVTAKPWRGGLGLRGALSWALAWLAASSSGCLSHEYRVSRPELDRLVALPPAARGERIRVVETFGSRRGPALSPRPVEMATPAPPAWGAPPEPPPEPSYAPDAQITIDVEGGGQGAARGADQGLSGGGGGSPPHRDHLIGAPESSGRNGGWRAVPAGSSSPSPSPSGAQAAGGGWRQAPAPPPAAKPDGAWRASSGGGSSGGGGLTGGSSGGGSGGGDSAEALVVIAVVVVVIAAVAVCGLAVTEGMRYDGAVATRPEQLLYLEAAGRGERAVPLGALAPADLAGVDEALLKDDEGFGLARLGRAPLDRRGFTLKLDLGPMRTAFDGYGVAGLAGNVQAGYFPYQRFGLLATLGLSGGDDDEGHLFARHSLGVEAQLFPVALRRLHLGLYGHAGRSIAAADQGTQSGTIWGGGLLVELDLTTRLALTARGGLSSAHRDRGGWDGIGSIAFGLAVY